MACADGGGPTWLGCAPGRLAAAGEAPSDGGRHRPVDVRGSAGAAPPCVQRHSLAVAGSALPSRCTELFGVIPGAFASVEGGDELSQAELESW